jgi:hypothetical protein
MTHEDNKNVPRIRFQVGLWFGLSFEGSFVNLHRLIYVHMKQVLLILILLVSGSLTIVPGQGCAKPENIHTFYFQGKKYEVVKELKTWEMAARCAVERGGYLVHINSKKEQDSVFSAIVQGAGVPVNYKTVSDGGGVAYVWIGATDRVSEGTWIWDGNTSGTGTPFWSGKGAGGGGGGKALNDLYNNWGGSSTASGIRLEPDDFNSIQDGAAMALSAWPAGSGSRGSAGEWNDLSMANTLYFVIEYDQAGSSVPTSESTAQINIFPNPANQQVRITTGTTLAPINTIRLFNILGSTVYEKSGIGTSDYTVNLDQYQTGAYFIQVVLENGQSVRKKVMIR